MCSLLVKDRATIFLSQYDNPGRIFKYDTVKGIIETVVEGLNKPIAIKKVRKTKEKK